jgi:hypothetical protein
MAAVVVTDTLDWRLHGFDLLSEHSLPGEQRSLFVAAAATLVACLLASGTGNHRGGGDMGGAMIFFCLCTPRTETASAGVFVTQTSAG